MTDPHPVTGRLFPSPVPPGTGWPGDPAARDTPVAHDADDVARLAAETAAPAQLDAVVSVCRACPRLVAWREDTATTGRRASFAHEPYWGRPVPGFGDVGAAVLVIGLAPAANGANRTGRMFTGDSSGDWLWAAFHRAGLAALPTAQAAGDGQELTDLRMTSAVRCAPPANKPTATERTTCAPFLLREITLMPRLGVLVALGGFAWQATLAVVRAAGWAVPRPAPRFGHGATVALVNADGRTVFLLGSYHPSQRNTSTGLLTAPMLDDVLATARSLCHPGAPGDAGSTTS